MFKQVELEYAYNALEPYIDALTMETHYEKHHKAYTNNLNGAVEKLNLDNKSIEELLSTLDTIQDEALRKAVRNNGGGFYNHNLYFKSMKPNGSKTPTGELKDLIDETFGSYDNLKDELSKLGANQFGSGWAWLSLTPDNKLVTSSTPNQDNPLMDSSNTPLLGIDVWEHAYYLKYKNLRGDYINAFFEVVNWDEILKNYKEALKK
ncbi:MAG: superoxide dismutase [Erysipelotrichaceae bacterium]|nr:superoxide dismutase [Erysipelotrichaceae bacterium]